MADATHLYFAYGSNLCCTQMASRCPASTAVGRALLPDHVLLFPRRSVRRGCGVAGVAPSAGGRVWGALYRLTSDDLAALDGHEGFDPARGPEANFYNRTTVMVLRNGDPGARIEAITYFAVPAPGLHRPNADYRDTMLRGAREHGLPHDYVAELERIAIQDR